MMTQHTLTQLKALKLDGMARAFEEQLLTTSSTSLPSRSASVCSSIVRSPGAIPSGSIAC
jgi:hypothetical protein